jgi:5-methylthioadenosine/S-adenosylhomocysteine deaminase
MSFTVRRGLILDPVGQPQVADIRVDGGNIASVGAPAPPPAPDDIDAAGMIVLPGLTDTHRHTWQSGMRGSAFGWDLTTYMREFNMRFAPRYTPADVYIGTLVGALTALDAGITTLRDESHVQNSWAHTTAAISALTAAGIRARFDYGWPSGPAYARGSALGHPAEMERVRAELLPDDNALVTMNAHLRGPGMSSPDIFADDLSRARALGLRSSIHAGSAPRDGVTPGDIEWMYRSGLLADDITLVHCGRATDAEFSMMAQAGAHASVTAALEATMPGLGAPAVARMLAAGLRPSLGVDVEVAVGGDLFQVMRAVLTSYQLQCTLQPGFGEKYPAPTARDILEFATTAGARACGLDGRVGAIAPGQAADLVLIRRTDINLVNGGRDIESVINGGHAGNVDTVIVGGTIRKRAGRLLGVDMNEIQQLLEASQSRLRAPSAPAA